MNDAEVMTAWLTELNRPAPDPVTVAALEASAEANGWQPQAVLAAFDEVLHPRGHDGRFIEIGGLMKIISGDYKDERGTVESITPDKSGRPTIRLKLDDGESIDVKPDAIEQAADKARLIDATDMPAVGRIPRSPKREGPAPTFAPGELDWIANRGQVEETPNEAGHKKWTYYGNETHTSGWGDSVSRPVTIRTELSDPAELDDEEVYQALMLVKDARYGVDPPEVTAYRDALQDEWRMRIARSYQ